MATPALTARLSDMARDNSEQARFRRLDEARQAHQISIDRLSKAARYKSNQNWYDLRDGKRPIETLLRFEEALQTLIENPGDIEEEPSRVLKSTGEGLIEVELTGDFGVRIVARASVNNAEQLEAFTASVLRDLRARRED